MTSCRFQKFKSIREARASAREGDLLVRRPFRGCEQAACGLSVDKHSNCSREVRYLNSMPYTSYPLKKTLFNNLVYFLKSDKPSKFCVWPQLYLSLAVCSTWLKVREALLYIGDFF